MLFVSSLKLPRFNAQYPRRAMRNATSITIITTIIITIITTVITIITTIIATIVTTVITIITSITIITIITSITGSPTSMIPVQSRGALAMCCVVEQYLCVPLCMYMCRSAQLRQQCRLGNRD